MSSKLEIFAVSGFPLVKAGDDLAAMLVDCLSREDRQLRDGDVVVWAQKVISKAEGRLVRLEAVTPSAEALELSRRAEDKDPRLVELILRESNRIVRQSGPLIIAEHRLGFVMANAGIDQSNVGESDCALLLPEDADASAEKLRASLAERYGRRVAVVINDSFGRPWRRGSVGVAIGCAGMNALWDMRGDCDIFGRELQVTEVALADEVAAAASLMMGQGNQAIPVVVLRGMELGAVHQPAATLVRQSAEDLFR